MLLAQIFFCACTIFSRSSVHLYLDYIGQVSSNIEAIQVQFATMKVVSTGALLLGTDGLEHRVNPIRKVVTMLQMMQNKVEADGKKGEALYDQFMCYCQNSESLLSGAITTAENKIWSRQSKRIMHKRNNWKQISKNTSLKESELS